MGFLLLCKTASGCLIGAAQCVVNDFFFVCNTLLIMFLVYQTYLRIFSFKIPLKMTTITYYLLIIQSIIYEIYNGFESWVWAYILEIYVRHLVFIYLMFFFSLKAWKFNDIPHKNVKITVIVLIFFCYFTGIVVYTLTKSEILIVCKDVFWLYSSIAGILTSLMMVGIAFKLSQGMNKKMRHFGIYDTLIHTNLADDIKTKNSFVKKKLEDKMEYVWKIVLYMSLSHYLSLCTYLYYIFNDNKAAQCPLLIPENENDNDNDKLIILNILVMIIVKIICYFLPIIVITITFWMKGRDRSKDDEEKDGEDEIGFFKNLTFASSKAKRSNQPISFSSSSDGINDENAIIFNGNLNST